MHFSAATIVARFCELRDLSYFSTDYPEDYVTCIIDANNVIVVPIVERES